MPRLRTRLLLAILVTTFIVMASLGLIIAQMFKYYYLEHVTDRIEKEANLAAYSIIQNVFYETNIQEMAVEISEQLDARITIILADGTVVGESTTEPSELENHLSRPEIESLKEGIRKKEIRFSKTVGAELLYITSPLKNDEEMLGFLRIGIPTNEVNGVIKNVWTALIISFTIAFTVILSTTFRIANQMISPVEEATKIANALAEGNYQLRAQEGRRDEIGQLSASINVLAFNLESVTKRQQIQQEQMETLIENTGSGLLLINRRGDIVLINRACRDIFQENTDLWINKLYYDVIDNKDIIQLVQTIFMTEEKQNKQVELSMHTSVRHFDVFGAPIIGNESEFRGIALVFHDISELKKLEQVRKDFVANVSHELKTPVTSIKGFTETLLDGARKDEKLSEKFLTIIDKESERLQNLITDLLELSRIEQHYFQMNWQDTNVSEIVYEVYELLKGKAEEKGVTLQIDEGEKQAFIQGDAARIKQITINLVSNAMMYTPKGGSVQMQVLDEQEHICLLVKDDGIGIPKDEIPRIFERFYRIDRARSRNSGGTGLGLAIVKHLVEAHHGWIEVESELEKGTTFSIFFLKSRGSII